MNKLYLFCKHDDVTQWQLNSNCSWNKNRCIYYFFKNFFVMFDTQNFCSYHDSCFRKTSKCMQCIPRYAHCFFCINTLRPRLNGCHFADGTFKCIFLNEDVRISIKISLKFVSKAPINNIPALVQIKAWCWPGNKPLSELMMVRLLTHICITRPQYIDGLVQDCSNSSALAMELPQSCTKPLISCNSVQYWCC